MAKFRQEEAERKAKLTQAERDAEEQELEDFFKDMERKNPNVTRVG